MLPLLSNAANRPVEAIDTPLEYYFGVMALIAIVMTWAWLWLRTRDSIRKLHETREAAAELDAAKATDSQTKETDT